MSSPRSQASAAFALEDADPRLALVARELAETRGAAMLWDSEWTLVWVSEELKLLIGEQDESKLGVGRNVIEAYMTDTWSDRISIESQLELCTDAFPIFMHDTPGGKERVVELVKRQAADCPEAFDWVGDAGVSDAAIDAFFEHVEPVEPAPIWVHRFDFLQEGFPPSAVNEVNVRLHDSSGDFFGTASLYDPGLPARVLALVARGSEEMYERMAKLTGGGRRQAAILFADLQGSAVLSRRLPSVAYFKLIKALTSAIDDIVVRRKGIVGKHAGDGSSAFFLSEDVGSSSAAVREAIEAARDVIVAARDAAKEVGEETGLVEAEDCLVNVAVHWGGTLYMGQLVTGGRLEVTALGDEVNECARIQQSARDGQVLVSKTLLEHLTDADADALGIDPDGVLYRTLLELPGATDKAKRDAGSIPVTTL